MTEKENPLIITKKNIVFWKNKKKEEKLWKNGKMSNHSKKQ